MDRMDKRSFVIGIDVGGTFTDIVSVDLSGNTLIAKAPTTPKDVSVGVIDACKKIARANDIGDGEFFASMSRLVYGTTVATNTLLQRTGVDTAYVTTRGFKDNLNLRRGWREGVTNAWAAPPVPIVPRHRCYEVTERIDCDGNVIQPLVEADVKLIAQKLKEANITAVAVCLLFSFVNPSHEQRVREILVSELPDAKVSLSSEICPEVREYERASTTVINAFLATTVAQHLENLELDLKERGFASAPEIMQSSGGVSTINFISERPVRIFLSGPAGGAMAGAFLAEHMPDRRNLLTVDMGGTSFDVCIIPEGCPLTVTETKIHGWTILSPMIDVHTIGAGGGSKAWADNAGGLHVGPMSAGSVPGPACYMRGGTEPTVTDADMALGYLAPDYFLGGEMPISREKAEEALKTLADRVGLSVMELAGGIFRIINNNMLGAMRLVSVQRGYDPRDFSVVAFGGAGAVHAAVIARELGARDLIVPMDASVLSALGLTSTDVRYDFVMNVNLGVKDISLDELNGKYADLIDQGTRLLSDSNVELGNMYFVKQADMKYPGQYRETLVPLPSTVNSIDDLDRAFADLHLKLYNYNEDESSQIVNLRLSAFGRVNKPRLATAGLEVGGCEGAIKSKRYAFFDELNESVQTPVYDGKRIRPGNKLRGPAIVELPTTTIVVRPDQSMTMDELFNFNITLQSGV